MDIKKLIKDNHQKELTVVTKKDRFVGKIIGERFNGNTDDYLHIFFNTEKGIVTIPFNDIVGIVLS